tara:strand:+ start:872 stop:1000 length:129 start_codon:yes stop_codon:yes gene_type:complete
MSGLFVRPAGVERRPEPVKWINELVEFGGSLQKPPTNYEIKV